MLKITAPTTLRLVLIARLLEQQGSPLSPLAEEIYDLAIAYRIDAAFVLAQCMVENQLGCLSLAQVNRNAALVRVASGARRGGAGQSQASALHQALVSQQEISAYARRIARYRAAYQAPLNGP